jgi:hypothetical protein
LRGPQNKCRDLSFPAQNAIKSFEDAVVVADNYLALWRARQPLAPHDVKGSG